MAQIPSCFGYGVGWQLKLRFNLRTWELPYAKWMALIRKKKKIEHLGDVPGQVRAPLPSPSCSVVESGLSHPPQAPGMLGICLLKGGWPTLTGQ